MPNFKENIRLQRNILTQFRKKTDGNTSVLFAGGLSVLLLSIAGAIDITSTFSTKSKMQDALDAAVLAAAVRADQDNFSEIGLTAYKLNIADGLLNGVTVTFDKVTNNNVDEIVGTASGSRALVFAGVLKKSALDISVRSVVKIAAEELPAPACIMALNTTAQPGVIINSGASLIGPGCNSMFIRQQITP